MKLLKLITFLIKISLIILIFFSNSNPYTIPLLFSIMVLYIFLLESRINFLRDELQINVNLIESTQKDNRILVDNQKILNKAFKELNNKLNKLFVKNKDNIKNNNLDEL